MLEPKGVEVKRWHGDTLAVLGWIDGGANSGSIDHLVGLFVPNKKRHTMTDIFGNVIPKSQGFVRVGWEVNCVEVAMDQFKPRQLEKQANVGGVTGANEVWLTGLETRLNAWATQRRQRHNI